VTGKLEFENLGITGQYLWLFIQGPLTALIFDVMLAAKRRTQLFNIDSI